MNQIKSPLRYPGGKSKAIAQILPYLPKTFSEYREPFLGGGSLFVYLKQLYPQRQFWINDLNYDLYCFWKCAQSELDQLVEEVRDIKRERKDGRELFEELATLDVKGLSKFDRAVRFFVLNRISFSGTVDAGGFSQGAFEKRFTDSSIERLLQLKPILEGVRITNFDYRFVLKEAGDNAFIFLDPPYLSATKSKLYGRRGHLHTIFNHEEFAKEVKTCRHKWLITYDDSSEIRQNFSFAHAYEWELQYGMNNYKQKSAAKGRELFLTNYEVSERDNRLMKQAALF